MGSFTNCVYLPAFAAATVEGGERQHQRQDMGLVEYQAIPSLRDVAHDGVLCTLVIL
jgi:hypothetical protein